MKYLDLNQTKWVLVLVSLDIEEHMISLRGNKFRTIRIYSIPINQNPDHIWSLDYVLTVINALKHTNASTFTKHSSRQLVGSEKTITVYSTNEITQNRRR